MAPRPAPKKWARFTHLSPYRKNNSPAGLRHAARNSKAIDIDVIAIRGNVIIATHWLLALLMDGFRDPLGLIGPRTPVTELTWDQVKRLRSEDGYRIRKLTRMLRLAARLGVKRVEIEAKAGQWLTQPDAWTPISELVRELAERHHGFHVVMKVSTRRPGYAGRVAHAAHSAGLQTMLLPRGTRVMHKRWKPYVTYVRGRVIWVDPKKNASRSK